MYLYFEMASIKNQMVDFLWKLANILESMYITYLWKMNSFAIVVFMPIPPKKNKNENKNKTKQNKVNKKQKQNRLP